MTDDEKYMEEKFQIYSPHNVFIKGWYTAEELQDVIATLKRIIRANLKITQDFTDNKTSG